MTTTISENQLIQMIRQEEDRLNEMQSFFTQLEGAIIEATKTIETLKEIQKKPSNIMIKIGSGVLVEAQITNFEKVSRAISENGYKTDNVEGINSRINFDPISEIPILIKIDHKNGIAIGRTFNSLINAGTLAQE